MRQISMLSVTPWTMLSSTLLPSTLLPSTLLSSTLLLNAPSTSAASLSELNLATAAKVEQLRAKYQLPSLVLAVDYQGELQVNQAAGYANLSQAKLATTSTTYSVGSIAKSMTSLAMMRLVEQGKLALHTPISEYSDYQSSWQPLTVAQLSSHTAGVVHYNDARQDREFVHTKDHWRPEQALDVFAHEALLFTPSEGFQYSSSGYILLSDVLAKASDMPYLQLMEQQVFQPLAMSSTAFDAADAFASVEAEYYLSAKKRPHIGQSVSEQVGQQGRQRGKRDRSFLFGGGGYQSTAKDLVTMAWQMQSSDYLQASSREKLFTPVTIPDGKSTNSANAKSENASRKNNPQNYGFGFRIHDMDVSQFIPGKRKQVIQGIHHGGTMSPMEGSAMEGLGSAMKDFGAANAYMLTFPEFGLSLAYTTNAMPESKDKNDNMQVEMWLLLYQYVEALQSND